MPKSQLQLSYRKIAGSHNFENTLELLEAMRLEAVNVNNKIGDNDSIELRKAIDFYLNTAITEIRRIRKNELTGNQPTYDDNV